MTNTGMRPVPDPDDPMDIDGAAAAEVADVPAEEHLDPATVEEDLEKQPDEKENATDGYAPAEDD